MNIKEVSARFDTPSTVKMNQLRKENDMLSAALRKNNRQIEALIPAADKEQDAAANKLDKDFPGWRNVIVKAYKSR